MLLLKNEYELLYKFIDTITIETSTLSQYYCIENKNLAVLLLSITPDNRYK